MTDKDIVSIIKKDIVNGHTGNFLTLEVIDRSKNSMKIFSEENLDDMVCTLFEHSMTKNIVLVKNRRYGIDEYGDDIGFKSYNGSPFPIIGYTFVLSETGDHNTNITPSLMKLLEAVLHRGCLDKLAYPLGRRQNWEVKTGIIDSMGGIVPMINIDYDPWDAFEEYLIEDETP